MVVGQRGEPDLTSDCLSAMLSGGFDERGKKLNDSVRGLQSLLRKNALNLGGRPLIRCSLESVLLLLVDTPFRGIAPRHRRSCRRNGHAIDGNCIPRYPASAIPTRGPHRWREAGRPALTGAQSAQGTSFDESS